MSVYGLWVQDRFDDAFTGATVKALLTTSAYVQDRDTHRFRSDITGQVTGAGYTAGGVTVTGVAVAYDALSDTVRLTCDDVPYGAVTLSDVSGIVFYISTGSAATDPLIAFDSFGPEDVDGAFTYFPHGDGIVTAAIE